jgi:hypothetical protein
MSCLLAVALSSMKESCDVYQRCLSQSSMRCLAQTDCKSDTFADVRQARLLSLRWNLPHLFLLHNYLIGKRLAYWLRKQPAMAFQWRSQAALVTLRKDTIPLGERNDMVQLDLVKSNGYLWFYDSTRDRVWAPLLSVPSRRYDTFTPESRGYQLV